jgi:DNA-binding NarL/FixJ family response regulator
MSEQLFMPAAMRSAAPLRATAPANWSGGTGLDKARRGTTSATRASKGPRRTAPRTRQQILVVDDHPIVRFGLRRLLDQQRDLAVCSEAESTEEAEAALRKFHPDLLIVDISLKHGDGIELVKYARAHNPKMPILVLSMHDETIYAERVLAAGANGYVMKQAAPEEFLVALRRVLEGGVYVSEVVGSSMIRKLAAGGRYASADPIERLSNRELQILQIIGSGHSTRDAASALNLSMKTIESHRQRIKRKLNLTTGSQLLQYAVNWFAKSDAGAA